MSEKLTYTVSLREIETNHAGVSELLKFYSWADKFKYKSIDLNISPCNSVDANLSALVLAMVHKLSIENKIYTFLITARHMNVFLRNGLIAHLQKKGNANPYVDNRESTIPCKMFDSADYKGYCEYMRREFLGHHSLGHVKTTTKNQIATHFEEVFINSQQHAKTNYPIFTCGQYFPEKNILKFTLVDMGQGFLPKITERTEGKIVSDNQAIVWATHGLNTTKENFTFVSGGNGLKELKNYCSENDGTLHIGSGQGYVIFIKDKTLEYHLPIPLPGSIINLIFRKI